MKTKTLVKYIEEMFFSDIEDFNGKDNALDLLFDFYQKNQVFNGELVTLLDSVKKRIEQIPFPDKQYLSLAMGIYIGLILGKFSEKIQIEEEE